jgi:hypothetical protein
MTPPLVWATRDPSRAVVALFVTAAALWIALGDPASDEGMLTWFSAAFFVDHPAAALFLQRFHPSLGALYAPAAALGWGAFVAAHVALAAAGVYAVSRWVARLGGDGLLASLVVASSPAYLFGAVTGQSNTDGVALLLIAGALAEGPSPARRLGGGLVLGLLVWARYEYAPVVVALSLHALLHAERRPVALGAALYALTYLGAGALYHGSPVWFIEQAPLEDAAPGIAEAFRLHASAEAVRRVWVSLALVSGAWPVVLTRAALGPPGAHRALALQVALMFAFVTSPFFGVNGPEVVPRYLSVGLPAVALAAGFSRALVATPSRATVSGCVGVVAWFLSQTAEPASALLLVAVLLPAATALLPLAPPARRGPAWLAVLLAPSLVAALSPRDVARIESTRAPVAVADVVARLARRHRPRRIITNVQSLVPALLLRDVTVARYLVAYDVALGMNAAAASRRGQRAALLDSFRRRYERGGAVMPCDLGGIDFLPGDLVVLAPEWRTDALTPPTVWEPFTEPVARVGEVTVLRVTRGPARVALPPPPPALAGARVDDLCAPAR